MAIHTNGCWRKIGSGGYFNIVMAVAAIDTEIAGVEFMAVWHRLFWAIADIGIFGRAIIPDKANHANSNQGNRNSNISWDFICPPREYLSQSFPFYLFKVSRLPSKRDLFTRNTISRFKAIQRFSHRYCISTSQILQVLFRIS